MRKATILIVEDDGILALHLQDMLSRLGYTVAGPLASGERAVAFVSEHPIDLILMDIELAGTMNGIDAAETIQRTADIPIVFLTGFSQDPLVEQAKIATPYGYLIKPVPERELVATLELALHRHSLDRKLAESRIALQKSEAQYRHLFENSPLGIFRTTLDGRPLLVNAEMARIVGCATPEEAISEFKDLGARLYVDPGRRMDFISLLQQHGAVNHFEYEGRKKNGETLWISMNARLTPADTVQAGGWVIDGFAIDITDRKKAEEALRESEQKYRTLANHGQALIWTSGTDKFCNYFNDIWLEFTGRSLEQELGNGWVEGVHPDDLQRVWISCRAFDRREKFSMVYRLRRHDGEYRWLLDLMDVHAIMQKVNSLVISAICLDITTHKRAEEEKNNLQAQLQQAQKMEAIGTLAGGIAHDFNNILGAILGYAEMAQEDCPSGSQIAKDLDQVIRAGTRARDLVKQILAFSRQAATEQLPLQPASIIKEAIKLLRSSLPTTIDIEQDIDPESGLIFADPTQIHQVLMNLCTNAFHAMETMGGILTISLKKKMLSPQELADHPGLQPGNFVQLSVGDSGPGIAPEIRERIFDPYFTTKETGKGTGMGLAIVHGIVKSYGGLISCHSRPGEGAVFTITLPALEERAVSKSEPVESIPVGSERILFVDDETMLAEMGQAMLEKLGIHGNNMHKQSRRTRPFQEPA